MADNEKLDNQRLKNFKNKGRDLEVMCFYSRWEVSFLSVCAILLLWVPL